MPFNIADDETSESRLYTQRTCACASSTNDNAIVTKTDVPSNSADAVEPAKKEEEIITDLTQFGTEKPTLLYESVISKLYAGIQCKMCADRFVTKECVILAES